MPNLRIFAVNESFFLRNALYLGCLCADGSGGDIVYMCTDMLVSGDVITGYIDVALSVHSGSCVLNPNQIRD